MNKEIFIWDAYDRYNYIKEYFRYRRTQISEKLLGHECWALPNYEAGKKLMSIEQTNQIIAEKIKAGDPFWVGRFGGTEMNMMISFLRHRIHHECDERQAATDKLCELSGFFPNDIEMGERFVDLMIDICSDIDLQAAWGRYMADYILKKYQPNTNLTRLDRIEPWNAYKAGTYVKPWSHALKGKKVLVVHPFTESIIKQYAIREKIFNRVYETEDILPKFELKTLKAVQTLAGENDPRFKDWFEALDWMSAECQKEDFDVAIIGCGAYGYPLAGRIKKMGKCVIHLAGATQLLFGITGRRWETEYTYKSFREEILNEYWTKPQADEGINNKQSVEGACYW